MADNSSDITSLDDPRAAAFRNLKDRELARLDGRFIAEGTHLVERLLRSDYPVESILLTPRRFEEMKSLVKPGIPLLVAEHALLNEVVGFRFHAGVIACGRRKPVLRVEDAAPTWTDPVTLVICPEVSNAENMGALIRVSAAFGATALLLGPHCCDPFYRQSVRVSMGTIFHLPLIFSDDLPRDLRELQDLWKVELAATVLGENAEPLSSAKRSARLGLLFGNEAQGLGDDLIGLCDRRITIPMQLGTDSLNLAVAAGIFLYHFTKKM